MARKTVLKLTIEGAPEHRGHPMAHALVEKWDRFLKTFAAFERARIGKGTRQTDFEVVGLQHNSPAEIGLNPVPRVPNYAPDPVVTWTLDQWDKIAKGHRPDAEVDDDLLTDVAELSSVPLHAEFKSFSISYGRRKILLDGQSERNALALRSALAVERKVTPWMAGVSLGTLTGELKSVLDAHDERQIVLVPPVGADYVECNFTDALRDEIRANLFKFVRVTGTLHYTERSPFPYLVDLVSIQPLSGDDERPHLASGRGLFKESFYEQNHSDWA